MKEFETLILWVEIFQMTFINLKMYPLVLPRSPKDKLSNRKQASTKISSG
jgi:hypothetical protein